MKIGPILYTLPALLVAPAALADISTGRPAAPAAATQGAAHVDLLASNVVHAALKELRSMPVLNLDSAATPETQQIAIFEVKQNLAHRRYDRMGDAALQPGKLFPVVLSAEVPGQDAALADKIRAMQPGDEAVMRIDHLYRFLDSGNENVRSCTRFEKAEPREAAPAAPAADIPAPAAPTPAAPAVAVQPTPGALNPRGFHATATGGAGHQFNATSVESRIFMEPDGQGGMRRKKVEIHREWSNSGEKVRKFINDVEVDPQTDQPLAAPAPQDAPTPPPAAEDALPPIPDPPAAPDKGA